MVCVCLENIVILPPYSGFKFIGLGFIQRCLCVQNVTRVPKRAFSFGLDEGFRCLEANFPKICSTNGKILRVCSRASQRPRCLGKEVSRGSPCWRAPELLLLSSLEQVSVGYPLAVNSLGTNLIEKGSFFEIPE